MPTTLSLTAALAVFAALVAGPSSALAAAPSNDRITGAIATAPGFGDELDTTEATTDGDDASLNAGCGAPATDASVWYTYTPPTAGSGGAIVDVTPSSYSAGVIVATGVPGALQVVICGAGRVAFEATPDTTYHLLVIDDQYDGGGNGGTLRITISEAPPPPTVELSVDPTGTVDGRTGVATVGGTITCANAEFAGVTVQLEQSTGVRATVDGVGFFSTPASSCVGTPQSWTASITPAGGRFAGGKTASLTFAFACATLPQFICADGYAEQTIKLRGS